MSSLLTRLRGSRPYATGAETVAAMSDCGSGRVDIAAWSDDALTENN